MGQRFQTVIILPKVFMNQDNPNNRNELALVYHNQWLYGFKACQINLMIMQRIKEGISKRKGCAPYGSKKEGYINHFLEKSVNNAIKWAGLQDLHNERYFHEAQEIELGKDERLSQALYRQDNNNGYCIIKIGNDLNIEYAFISGLEDTPQYLSMTPEDYFLLFYKREDFEGLSKKDKKVFENLKDFKMMNKEAIDLLIKEMNDLRVNRLYQENLN